MWKYNSTTGDMLTPEGFKIGVCYSGHGAGLNNPSMENVRGVGPIPRGFYQFGEFFDDLPPSPPDGNHHKGPMVCHLVCVHKNADGEWEDCPAPYGRSGFMLHGDNGAQNHTASDGCIIAARFIRAKCSTSTDKIIEVV